MRLFIDTEFNDFKGDLISMALVDENGKEWYEVLECHNPSVWVLENVMTKLNKQPCTKQRMQLTLYDFLNDYDNIHIIADWPEDIKHFCDTLICGAGIRLDTPPLTVEVVRGLDNTSNTSAIPHNALEDAKALRLSYLENN